MWFLCAAKRQSSVRFGRLRTLCLLFGEMCGSAVRRGEERTDREGKAVDLPADPRPDPYRPLQVVASEQKNEIIDTRSKHPSKSVWALHYGGGVQSFMMGIRLEVLLP